MLDIRPYQLTQWCTEAAPAAIFPNCQSIPARKKIDTGRPTSYIQRLSALLESRTDRSRGLLSPYQGFRR